MIDDKINKEQQDMIIQLTNENDELLQKAQALSDNLKTLAVELENMKEMNERLQKECGYLRRKSS